MQVPPASPTPQAGASPSVNQALSGFGKNFDSFLQLLTAQLKNQDPLAPLNATEFTTQLVQFTSVEQAIRQNQNLESLIALQKSTQVATAVSYIGKTVEASGNEIILRDGQGTFSYTLPTTAASASVTITDAQGRLVRTGPGLTAAGTHSFVWDGRDNDNRPMPNGTYTVRVSAQDGAGQPLTVSTNIVGTVTDVALLDDIVMLTIAGRQIPVSRVLSVR